MLTACAPAPSPSEPPKPDPTAESWYGQTVEQLAALNRKAESLMRQGPSDQAGAILTEGQPLMNLTSYWQSRGLPWLPWRRPPTSMICMAGCSSPTGNTAGGGTQSRRNC